jgi:hypothetical protein
MEFAWDKFEVGASVSSIRRLLKACNWSKKKNRRVARERDPEVRDACSYEPSECKSFQLIFVDESGCDRLASVRRTGWAARGMPAIQSANFHREQGHQVLPAYTRSSMTYTEIFWTVMEGTQVSKTIRRLIQIHFRNNLKYRHERCPGQSKLPLRNA